jgi:5-(carboxyamino)imidazole ribonucleotide synthase
MKRVGILGGGQLGLLLGLSIVELGGAVIIYEPDPQAPACKTFKNSINAAWNDIKALSNFISQCDVVTYEFENVDSEALSLFADSQKIIPSAAVLRTTQNRGREKSFLKDANLPHVPFRMIATPEETIEAAHSLTFPLVVKSTFGGYDGKLQKTFTALDSLKDWLDQLKEEEEQAFFPAVLEERINLVLEVSCITARVNEEEYAFPLFENAHEDHVLESTICPARLDQEVAEAIRITALDAARKLNAYGLLCTEFFIADRQDLRATGLATSRYAIYVNEFAPRPHNSGHVTMSATNASQFDLLARILLGVPLVDPKMVSDQYFCMGNLLGEVWLAQGTEDGGKLNLSAAKNFPELSKIILYGKNQARAKRKMGHFIVHHPEAAKALERARQFRRFLSENRIKNAL